MEGFTWHLGHDGSLQGTSIDNLFGGHDYLHPDGSLAGSTHHNIFGGHDYFDDLGTHLGGSIPTHLPHAPAFHHADGHIGSYPHMLDGQNDLLHSDIHNDFLNYRGSLLDQIR